MSSDTQTHTIKPPTAGVQIVGHTSITVCFILCRWLWDADWWSPGWEIWLCWVGDILPYFSYFLSLRTINLPDSCCCCCCCWYILFTTQYLVRKCYKKGSTRKKSHRCDLLISIDRIVSITLAVFKLICLSRDHIWWISWPFAVCKHFN